MSKNMTMTEQELAEELKGALLVLTTSSPDKRAKFGTLFAALGQDDEHGLGIDVFYTHSGKLRMIPVKTPEKTGDYSGNLLEKSQQQLAVLQEQEVSIRAQLKSVSHNAFDPDTVSIMGMTEDSGWEIAFDHLDNPQEKSAEFMDEIRSLLGPKLRSTDSWLLNKLDETGFPGPNLKPLQEHLQGGFHDLMMTIYQAAEQVGMADLRYNSTADISFSSPATGKILSKNFVATGLLVTRQAYESSLIHIEAGEAINSNFVHVPYGQDQGARQTMVEMDHALLTKSSADMPASYDRRDMTEWLQGLIGKRKTTPLEQQRDVKIAYASASSFEDGASPQVTMAAISDYKVVQIPAKKDLQHYPDMKQLGEADVVMVVPDKTVKNGGDLVADPNLAFAINMAVTVETDPRSMNIPIILDNRGGEFGPTLALLSDAFVQGRLIGDFPFHVVDGDEQLNQLLTELKNIRQRAPLVQSEQEGLQDNQPIVAAVDVVPDDGKMAVFVAGGHNNNSKQDVQEAYETGYLLASLDVRIVTGGGQVEGSMGATHTGFVQYHLDQVNVKNINQLSAELQDKIRPFYDEDKQRYGAERMVLDAPELLDSLADEGVIPRDMFHAISTDALVKMESPNGQPPPATDYQDSGNRVRRLDALLAPGTKMFLSGSIGTDEEFEETIKQHLEVRLSEGEFADGTPNNQAAIIVYNRDGHLDKLLIHHGLLGDDPITKLVRDKHNITIVNNVEQLKEATNERADLAKDSWLDRVQDGGVEPQERQV